VDYRWSKYFISAGNNQVHTNPILAPDANQFRFRAGLGDVNRKGWNAAYDVVYDYRAGITQFSTSQVTYNTSCCGISVQYRRYNFGLRDWSEWRVAFAVADIGTFGNLRKQDRLF
jgi:LPS-assembly protein